MLMGPVLSKKLLLLARAYQAATGCKMSSLSKWAHSDSRFFDSLAAGKISFSARKYDQVVVWFYRNWPDGIAWPAIVEMPTEREIKTVEKTT